MRLHCSLASLNAALYDQGLRLVALLADTFTVQYMATDEEKAAAEARAQLLAQRLQDDFYKAAYTNDLAGLLMATSKGVDVNEVDEFGSTALHFAAQHGTLS